MGVPGGCPLSKDNQPRKCRYCPLEKEERYERCNWFRNWKDKWTAYYFNPETAPKV